MKRLAVTCLVLLLVLFSTGVYAGYIKDVQTDPEEIDPDDSFSVVVELKTSNWAKTLNFYLDDVLFDSKNVGSDDETVESVEWDPSERGFGCGPHKLTVQITRRTGEIVENDTQIIDIGNVPSLVFSPEKPNPDKVITLTFRDKKTGAAIKNADVIITKLRDIEGTRYTGKTNANGEMSFTTSRLGEYKIEMSSREHCMTKNFWIKKNMMTDGPHPENPIVGGLISFAIPPGVGLKVADSEGKIIKTASTSITGGVNFTLNKEGNYTVIIGELSTEYWGKNVSIRVYDKLTAKIEVSPDKPLINSPIRLHVSVPGQLLEPIESLEVEVMKPTGEESTYIADEEGYVEFTPLVVGEYVVKVSREDLRTVTKSLNALNAFNVDLVGGDYMVNDEIDVVVKDQANILVPDASMTVENTGVSGLTDVNGGFSFNISNMGTYTLSITKENYWPYEEKFNVSGFLCLNLSAYEIELGESIDISVFDMKGGETDALLMVQPPDQEKIRIEGASYKPNEVGTYRITASKNMYQDVQSKLVVIPHDIKIRSNLSGEYMVIRVSSKNKPVEGMSVLLETNEGTYNAITDSDGIAEYEFKKDGLVTINANLVDSIREYKSKSVSYRIYKVYDYLILVVVLGLIIAASAASIFLINYGRPSQPAKKEEKKGPLERDGKKGRLSKV